MLVIVSIACCVRIIVLKRRRAIRRDAEMLLMALYVAKCTAMLFANSLGSETFNECCFMRLTAGVYSGCLSTMA